MPVSLRLENVSKRYGDHVAVDDVSLEIGAGKFVTLLGPSGSGKTTLLMMIAGFARPSSGRVFAASQEITNLAPEQRDFGMVFQGYALFPNMNVAENLAFPLKLRKMPRADIAREVERMLDIVRLGGLGQRYPRELSGGQQQRVALARALIFNPKVLLLDESLSALDKNLRAGLQEELRDLHTRLGTTFVFVTHDQDEALSMSDEIVIVNHGRIMQRGSPKSLYDRPESRFVADFLGRANFIDGVVDGASPRETTYSVAGHAFRQGLRPGEAAVPTGKPILIGLRPEQMALTQIEPADGINKVAGTIASLTYEGADYHVRVSTPFGAMQVVVAASQLDDEPVRGASVWLSWRPDASVVLRDDR
jgi:putative spermidine/putrescine transport system ATP-binding protein